MSYKRYEQINRLGEKLTSNSNTRSDAFFFSSELRDWQVSKNTNKLRRDSNQIQHSK